MFITVVLYKHEYFVNFIRILYQQFDIFFILQLPFIYLTFVPFYYEIHQFYM